jgi:hypothetical protein
VISRTRSLESKVALLQLLKVDFPWYPDKVYMLRPGPTSIFDPKVRRCLLCRHNWASFWPQDATCKALPFKGEYLQLYSDVQMNDSLVRLQIA